MRTAAHRRGQRRGLAARSFGGRIRLDAPQVNDPERGADEHGENGNRTEVERALSLRH
jgi:hypothetical protein